MRAREAQEGKTYMAAPPIKAASWPWAGICAYCCRSVARMKWDSLCAMVWRSKCPMNSHYGTVVESYWQPPGQWSFLLNFFPSVSWEGQYTKSPHILNTTSDLLFILRKGLTKLSSLTLNSPCSPSRPWPSSLDLPKARVTGLCYWAPASSTKFCKPQPWVSLNIPVWEAHGVF